MKDPDIEAAMGRLYPKPVPGMEKLGGQPPPVPTGQSSAVQGGAATPLNPASNPLSVPARALANLPRSLHNFGQAAMSGIGPTGSQPSGKDAEGNYDFSAGFSNPFSGVANAIRHPGEAFAEDPVGTGTLARGAVEGVRGLVRAALQIGEAAGRAGDVLMDPAIRAKGFRALVPHGKEILDWKDAIKEGFQRANEKPGYLQPSREAVDPALHEPEPFRLTPPASPPPAGVQRGLFRPGEDLNLHGLDEDPLAPTGGGKPIAPLARPTEQPRPLGGSLQPPDAPIQRPAFLNNPSAEGLHTVDPANIEPPAGAEDVQTINKYREAIRAGQPPEPVEGAFHPSSGRINIRDGYHRVAAARAEGAPVQVRLINENELTPAPAPGGPAFSRLAEVRQMHGLTPTSEDLPEDRYDWGSNAPETTGAPGQHIKGPQTEFVKPSERLARNPRALAAAEALKKGLTK
jgi:hypothetical protein